MQERHFAFWPEGVPRQVDVPAHAVHDNLERRAARVPDAIAISYYGTQISYRELARDVERLAGYLQRRMGVARGDRVPLVMQNSPHFVIAYYAILRADAVVVPLSPMLKADDLARIFAELDARVVIAGREQVATVAGLLAESEIAQAVIANYADRIDPSAVPDGLSLPAVVDPASPPPALGPGMTGMCAALAADLAPSPSLAQPDDLAVIPYTSGSTGESRGCMHTHRTVQSNICAYAAWNPLDETSVFLGALPFFHVTGMQGVMNVSLMAGARTTIMTRWDADTALLLTELDGITQWRLITTMLIDLMSRPRFTAGHLRLLKRIGGGGAAMPEALAKRLYEVTGLEYVEGYGLSETMAATHINPFHRAKRQCLGMPFIGVESLVVDSETLAIMPQGEVGEIVIRGPQVFTGYWKKPELTAAAFIEIAGKRYFRSGDLGYVDADGYYFLVDRVKRMVNASGFKIWPAEIEALLHAHPAVSEACVVAIPDVRRGETAKAVIVPKAGEAIDPAEIKSWLASRLSSYKVPTDYALVTELPRLASGKVDWRRVQDAERRRVTEGQGT
jgi:fatty-acyl-CoA synthase